MQITSPAAAVATAAQNQSTADLLSQNTSYSATVAGKTYNADIQLSAGQYVATIPQLPGITASGSSLLIAENNLYSRISLLA